MNAMTFNLHTCVWSRGHAFAASFIRAFMASLLLAVLVAQTNSIKFYDLQTSGACRGECISLVRRPDSVYDVNYLDGSLGCDRFLFRYIEAFIAAHLGVMFQ